MRHTEGVSGMPAGRRSLECIADDVWIDTDPVRILGMKLTATMAVVRLPDSGVAGGRGLLLYSPLSLTPARRAIVESLGRVEHLYAPNLFHHLYIGDWGAAFPTARLHAPAGLGKKRPDLKIDREHASTPEHAFVDLLDEVRIDGFRLDETVLVHRPSRTLLVADLVHNVGRPEQAWARIYTKAMGFYGRVALSRMIRATGFPDKAAARRSVEHLLTLPFDRVVVGHGSPVETEGQRQLASAYRFLGVGKLEPL